MFPRYLFALCALFLFAAVAINAQPVEEPQVDLELVQVDDEVEARNPLLAVAIRVLAQAFKWAAKHCIEEAAHNCKAHWKNPKNLVKCGSEFFKHNKGRCVTG